jgi:glycerol kinase
MGERCPFWNPNARGCFIGLSIVHTKNHIIRAVFEGVAYNMKLIAEAFEQQGAEYDLNSLDSNENGQQRKKEPGFDRRRENPAARLENA